MFISSHDKIVLLIGGIVAGLLLLLAAYQLDGAYPLSPGYQLSARTNTVRLAHHPPAATRPPAVCGDGHCDFGELDSCTPCLPNDSTCVPTCLPGSCPADCTDIQQRTDAADAVYIPEPMPEPRLSLWQRVINFFARLF